MKLDMMFRSLVVASLLIASVTGQCPSVPDGGCSVCGEGLCVGNPETIFAFPGFPAVPCGALQEAGYTGAVPISQCPFLPGLIGDCGCGTGSAEVAPPTPAPVAPVVPPTSVPVPAPTSVPVPAPTAVPVPAPTAVPVPRPTSVPVPAPTTVPVPATNRPTIGLTPSPVNVPTSAGKKSGGGMGKRRALSDHSLRHGRAF